MRMTSNTLEAPMKPERTAIKSRDSAQGPLPARWHTRTALGLGFVALLAGAAAPSRDVAENVARNVTDSVARETRSYVLSQGQTHRGDLYKIGDTIRIEGEQDGDLTAIARSVSVSGTVTGDLNVAAGSTSLSGTLGDSVRVTGDSLTVSGTLKGDLLAFCDTLTITKSARIAGDVTTGARTVIIEGEIDGELDATGGEVTLEGSVGGDACLKADIVSVGSGARIKGALDYTSRNVLDLDGKGIVGGEITHKGKVEKRSFRVGHVFKWFFFMATALIVGLAALAVTREVSPAILGTLGAEGLRSAGIGFIAVVVVPVALALSCILIVTIPVVIIAILVFGLVVYLAKMPVAILLGTRVLKMLGRPAPSSYAGLATGIPVLYLAFAVPYLGTLAWLGSLFAGMGAIVLGVWAHRQARRAAAAPPPVSPAPAG
jgi:cytoskeletal protein CcmA (bactofilin family)